MKRLLARVSGRRRSPGLTDDADGRIYAIGDIHGRLDLFRMLIERIRIDVGNRPLRPTRIVVLGDVVDRGPQSAQLVHLLMQLRNRPNMIVLKGNHEAIMADALAGNHAALDLWLAHGGLATLESYGMDPVDPDGHHGPALLREARRIVPAEVRTWLEQRPTSVRFGPFLFAHAGIRPGIPLAGQKDEDLLWIGDEFIRSSADHGAIVVHGHRIYEDGVDFAPNRIGVDTGAYRTGRLSAVGLDGDERWELTATDADADADALDDAHP